MQWKIGDGSKVRFGIDPWVGCLDGHTLCEHMVNSLQNQGYFFLSQINDFQQTNFIGHALLSADFVGFQLRDKLIWHNYLKTLFDNHIKSFEREDEILWCINSAGGKYTPNLEYIVAREEDDLLEPQWWHTTISKMNCPLKIILFMWLALSNIVPVWDILKIYEGPSMCLLCKNNNESITHLFVNFSYLHKI